MYVCSIYVKPFAGGPRHVSWVGLGDLSEQVLSMRVWCFAQRQQVLNPGCLQFTNMVRMRRLHYQMYYVGMCTVQMKLIKNYLHHRIWLAIFYMCTRVCFLSNG